MSIKPLPIKIKKMGGVPDELWRQILEMGIQNSKLNYKDLCCISISCRRLHRLSSEDSLWLLLLSSDFSSPNQLNPNLNNATSASAKSTYKIKYPYYKIEVLFVFIYEFDFNTVPS